MKSREMIKNNNNKDPFSIMLLGLTIFILVSVLYALIMMVFSLANIVHEQKMEQLQLEKAIATIKNPNNLFDSITPEEFCKSEMPYRQFEKFNDFKRFDGGIWCNYNGFLSEYRYVDLKERNVEGYN